MRPGYASPTGPALNVPNVITGARLVVVLVVLGLIRYAEGLWLLSAGLFVLASVADIVDGRLARRLGQVTTLGKILDPLVDKVAICGALILLSDKQVLHAGAHHEAFTLESGVSAWMVFAIVLRELYVSGLRTLMAERRQGFSPSVAGKTKMVLQCCAVSAALLSLSPWVGQRLPAFLIFRDALLWTAVAVTVYSGVSYTLDARRALAARFPAE